MKTAFVNEAIALLKKANADLEPALPSGETARTLLDAYARAEKLAAFGVAALARKVDDASQLARITGVSATTAKAVVLSGKTMSQSDELSAAPQQGDVSLDQATVIASAEESARGVAAELIEVAQTETFHVLKHRARKTKLEAEQHRDLGARQHAARCARSHSDELGMIHIHVALEPHIGTPIMARAEAEAARLGRGAKAEQRHEPFERHLADAYAALLSGTGKGRGRRPELVVLVSHEVAKRGWSDVRDGEVCKIPGVGPVAPEVASEIGRDAFLSGVFCDGKDLRNFARWSRT
ncbi:MAG: hypothetical protein M3214_13145, partial [Actinomycetota bacterium]|nr:hypothetical protein [Actinomycetota bacterium]